MSPSRAILRSTVTTHAGSVHVSFRHTPVVFFLHREGKTRVAGAGPAWPSKRNDASAIKAAGTRNTTFREHLRLIVSPRARHRRYPALFFFSSFFFAGEPQRAMSCRCTRRRKNGRTRTPLVVKIRPRRRGEGWTAGTTIMANKNQLTACKTLPR